MSVSDFQILTSFDNLYASYKTSIKGRRHSADAIRFDAMAMEALYMMQQQLRQHNYQIAPYREFMVSEPKPRSIMSGAFRDKVLQHCLCDYVLLPKLKSVFVLDNYAGQAGKGTLFGLNRLSAHLSAYHEQYGENGYILKCDITKFFYSIDHDILKQIVHRHFDDPDIQWICDLLIDSTPNPGLPLGNQSSQVFALLYLNDMDHLITDELHCSFFGRYMDDFFLLSDSKPYLQDCLHKIKSHLDALHLSLNHKTEIVPLQKGIRFLGFHTYLTPDGKVIRRLNGDNKRQAKKRFRKYLKLVQSGQMTRDNFDERFIAWKNHISHGNCYRLSHEMDYFVDRLLKEFGLEPNGQ